MKRGKGMAASKKQRDKVKELVCVYCGSEHVDPAHLWPRGLGGCDHPDCVVPLCREHHRAYDKHEIELLPVLVRREYFNEMGHAITHGVSPTELVKRLTTESE